MGEKALLVVSDQVDPEASHKLPICSDEVRRLIARARTQTTLNDLIGDFQRWIVIHHITEAIESILEKRLIGRDPLESLESCFNMDQGNPQLPADIGNREGLREVSREMVKDREQHAMLLERINQASLVAKSLAANTKHDNASALYVQSDGRHQPKPKCRQCLSDGAMIRNSFRRQSGASGSRGGEAGLPS